MALHKYGVRFAGCFEIRNAIDRPIAVTARIIQLNPNPLTAALLILNTADVTNGTALLLATAINGYTRTHYHGAHRCGLYARSSQRRGAREGRCEMRACVGGQRRRGDEL